MWVWSCRQDLSVCSSWLEILPQRQSTLLHPLTLSGLVRTPPDYPPIGRVWLVRRYVSPAALSSSFPPPLGENSVSRCWSKAAAVYHQNHESEWDGDPEWGKHTNKDVVSGRRGVCQAASTSFVLSLAVGCWAATFWHISAVFVDSPSI